MVHQHFMLIPVMTVAENIVLATEPTHGGVLLDLDEAERRVRELSERFGLAVDPRARIENIGVGQQQRVEILKALYRGAEILILDEPTAVLTPQEARSSSRSSAASPRRASRSSSSPTSCTRCSRSPTGSRCCAAASSSTRCARGRDRGGARPADGRPRGAAPGREGPSSPAGLLTVDDLHVVDDRGLEAVRGVSFEVRAGEIVGIAGVDGNGQTELIDAIAGLRAPASGAVRIGDRDVTRATARQALDAGLGHIPEDRQRRGLVLEFTIAENIALHDYAKSPTPSHGWLHPKVLIERAGRLLKAVRRPRRRPAVARRRALGRQPAEGRPGARDRARPARPDRRAAHARPRRRCDRVRAPPPRRGARRGARDPPRLARARRDPLALRPHPRPLRGRIVGEFGPDATEQELGIAMTGGGRKEAVA